MAATIVKGTTQPVTINTEPTGAACNVVRDGGTIGVVDPTPGTVQIAKIHRPLYVNCKKSGYEEISQQVHSQFQAMTLGNILIGGIIGFGVDAISGAMYEYPHRRHGGAGAAVLRHAGRARRVLQQPARRHSQGIRRAQGAHPRGVQGRCDAKLKAVDDAVATRAAEIETRRYEGRAARGRQDLKRSAIA
jgi:hypothetical protein